MTEESTSPLLTYKDNEEFRNTISYSIESPDFEKTVYMPFHVSERSETVEPKKSKLLSPAPLMSYFFDKIHPGSMKGSIFTLLTSIIGVGILAMPYAIIQAGVLLGTLLVILGALLAYFSLWLLVKCSIYTDITSYSSLSYSAGGYVLYCMTEICIALNLIGGIVGYIIGAVELFMSVIGSLQTIGSDVMILGFSSIFLLKTIAVVLIIFPLSLLRELSALRFTSVFVVGCIAYLTLICIFEYFYLLHLNKIPSCTIQWHSLPKFNFTLSNLLTSIPIIIFAYTCHPNVLPIYNSLKYPSKRRMNKIMKRSIALSLVLYLFVGLFVVFTFGTKTKSNFLRNDYFGRDGMILGTLCFSLALILTVPLFVYTLRHNITLVLTGYADLSTKKHFGLTACICCFCLFLSYIIPNISTVLTLLGATTNPIIAFILPSIYVVKLLPKTPETWKIKALSLIVAVSLTSICFLCLIQKIFQPFS